jgi:hypothetical protein
MIEWFAGLIDGEGCFMFHINRRGIRQVSVVPMFTIAMTPGNWEPVVISILNDNHIAFSHRTHSYLSEITVKSIINVKPLCELILPFTVIKKPVVERMMAFTGKMQWNQYKRANDNDIKRIADDVDFVRAFNRKRNVPYIWSGDKICEIYNVTR